MALCTCSKVPGLSAITARDPFCSVHGTNAQPLPQARPELQSAHEAVKDMLEERRQFGLLKYNNTSLTAFNGRNPAQDALEEAMDGAVYAWCANEERKVLIALLELAMAQVDDSLSRTIREALTQMGVLNE